VTWPQIVIAATLLLGALITIANTVRNRNLSATVVTSTILATVAYQVFLAMVLSAGGFW
jgi:hypothetical protein